MTRWVVHLFRTTALSLLGDGGEGSEPGEGRRLVGLRRSFTNHSSLMLQAGYGKGVAQSPFLGLRLFTNHSSLMLQAGYGKGRSN